MSQRSSSASELQEYIKKGKDKLIQVYEMLPSYCLQEDIPELLDGLRNTMKNYVVLESKIQDLSITKQIVAQEISKQNNPSDPLTHDGISEMLKTTFTKENEKHPEGFWENDQLYMSMKDFTFDDGNQADAAINSDEELAVTSETVQTTDPYSKQEFTDPVKNRNCGHSYERSVITSLIKSQVNGTKCYWMGCKNRNIKLHDLEDDYELRRYLARIRAKPI